MAHHSSRCEPRSQRIAGIEVRQTPFISHITATAIQRCVHCEPSTPHNLDDPSPLFLPFTFTSLGELKPGSPNARSVSRLTKSRGFGGAPDLALHSTSEPAAEGRQAISCDPILDLTTSPPSSTHIEKVDSDEAHPRPRQRPSCRCQMIAELSVLSLTVL